MIPSMPKRNYFIIFFSVFFAGVLLLLFLIFKPFLTAIAWAVILATLSYPVYHRLRKFLKTKSETLPALLMTFLVLFIIILPAIFLGISLTTETIGAYKFLEENYSAQTQVVAGQEWFEKLSAYLAQYHFNLKETLVNMMKTASSSVAAYTSGFFKGFVKTLVNFFLTMFTLFFLLRHGGKALQELNWVIPLAQHQKEQIFERFREVLYAILYGILLTAIVQGTLGGIGFWIAGLPSPVLFGALMAVCALIPVGGTSLVWIPAAVILYLQGFVGKAIFLIAWGFLIVGLVDNIIKPIFISGRSKLNFILVFFGILGGIHLFGLVGVFAGPLIIALFLALLEIFKFDVGKKKAPVEA